MILTEDEAKAKVKGYIDSHDWWILPWISKNNSDISIAIEEKWFDGKHGGGCQVFSLPPESGCFALTVFQKKRLTLKRLLGVIEQMAGAESVKAMADFLARKGNEEERDILAVTDGDAIESQQRSATRFAMFESWVYGWNGIRNPEEFLQ